jgi:hypothetical protein
MPLLLPLEHDSVNAQGMEKDDDFVVQKAVSDLKSAACATRQNLGKFRVGCVLAAEDDPTVIFQTVDRVL